MASSSGKKYGLIQNNKPAPGTFVPRPSIFGDDSASDDDSVAQGSSDWVKKAFQKESEKSTIRRQTKLNMQRALEQDPTIYQYDEVYDKIEEKKEESKLAKKDVDKKPKYITALLAQAERRKHENERRTERQVQKEREAEGEEFKDKEAFVTAAYRAKLEEFKKQDEEERYREQLEALTDVSKQKDLSGFYRHLYRQTVAGEEIPKIPSPKQETTEDNPKPDEEETDVKEKVERLYRKRKSSSSSSSSSSSESNQDADSDFSSSTSSDSDEHSKEKRQKGTGSDSAKRNKTDVPVENNEDISNEEITDLKPISNGSGEEKNEKEYNNEDNSVTDEPVVEVKPKINIWLKRTVGDVFDAALARYYARKAARLQTSH